MLHAKCFHCGREALEEMAARPRWLLQLCWLVGAPKGLHWVGSTRGAWSWRCCWLKQMEACFCGLPLKVPGSSSTTSTKCRVSSALWGPEADLCWDRSACRRKGRSHRQEAWRWQRAAAGWLCLGWAWRLPHGNRLQLGNSLFHSLLVVRPPNELFECRDFQTILMQSVAGACL